MTALARVVLTDRTVTDALCDPVPVHNLGRSVSLIFNNKPRPQKRPFGSAQEPITNGLAKISSRSSWKQPFRVLDVSFWETPT
jgi:hypothetical protein